MHVFVDHLTRSYAHIPINERRIKELVQCEMNKLPMAANAPLEDPIIMDELLNAMRKGKTRKSPGQDGICNEFYRMTWDGVKENLLDVLKHM